ncbi:glycosyltransferase family 2 protein [Saccharothrix sp. ALI-22-I]|uniref:glycosyltransferase family 2 protein n=1 Tax=Saccharothrix sp. ALI-22-I TaxID=1933778 RepID=UPI0015C4028F|nr:glycosyltransferase family 2 protein [Saccharothrix sp. ALI-22-I]
MYEVDCTVVSYNSASDLPRCIESLQKASGARVNITVVDNASSDDSAATAERLGVTVVRNRDNRGFAAAVNQGARNGTAPWVLVFNPDAVLPRDGLTRLIDTARSQDRVGCVGPRVVGEDGAEYPSGRRFPNLTDAAVHAVLGKAIPNNFATRRYHARDVDRTRTVAVDWVSGCCMLIPRTVWEELGGLDEAYFMYIEDMDFSLRARKIGYATLYEPAVSVMHLGGRSSRSRRIRSIYHHHVGALRFQWRLGAGTPRVLAFPLAAAFLLLRFAALTALSAVRGFGKR